MQPSIHEAAVPVSRYTVLDAIATGHPPLTRSQAYAAEFMQRVTSLPAPIRTRIPAIYERSGIEQRHSCVMDYGEADAADFTFYPPDWSLQPAPTTGQRNALYREAAVPLAEQVARDALAQAGRTMDEVTHVVAVTCTGFFAPGLDIELVKRLGLKPNTQRTVIGFMGCYAAFNGLRVANSFCQSDPNAVVLMVCVELCTLHFQVSETLEQAVINAIFSDGAAAAVLSSRAADAAEGHLAYTASHCLLDEDSMGHMTWAIGDHGFDMGLSPRVPGVLAQQLPTYLDGLLTPHGLTNEDLDFWAIHPGGRAIVDKAQAVLNLSDDQLRHSLGVLRDHGNMSSPTILFVLERFLSEHKARQDAGEAGFKNGMAMAFGPGLTLEGCLWQRVKT
ncbi:MAG: type III polyketide synthase [Rhodothermales bacterium]